MTVDSIRNSWDVWTSSILTEAGNVAPAKQLFECLLSINAIDNRNNPEMVWSHGETFQTMIDPPDPQSPTHSPSANVWHCYSIVVALVSLISVIVN